VLRVEHTVGGSRDRCRYLSRPAVSVEAELTHMSYTPGRESPRTAGLGLGFRDCFRAGEGGTHPREALCTCADPDVRFDIQGDFTPLQLRTLRDQIFAFKVSSLGDAKSSLGDAKSSLGDAKSSLGDVLQSLKKNDISMELYLVAHGASCAVTHPGESGRRRQSGAAGWG
jgi:hypothetical protein